MAFVGDLAGGIAFVVVAAVAAAATRDAVMLKLWPFLSHICRNCSFDWMKVAADRNRRPDDVPSMKEDLNKVDVTDSFGTILCRV